MGVFFVSYEIIYLTCYSVFVPGTEADFCTMHTCLLLSYEPSSLMLFCGCAKIIPELVGGVCHFQKRDSKRQLIAVVLSTKPGALTKADRDETGSSLGSFPGSRRGHVIASRWSPQGISLVGIVWKWRLLALDGSRIHRGWKSDTNFSGKDEVLPDKLWWFCSFRSNKFQRQQCKPTI